MKKISKVNLFLELAQPDKTGNSRKVLVSEFVGKYERLKFGNGGERIGLFVIFYKTL